MNKEPEKRLKRCTHECFFWGQEKRRDEGSSQWQALLEPKAMQDAICKNMRVPRIKPHKQNRSLELFVIKPSRER